ncbi:hypothetical protein F4778DRAFT_783117 [Xylariomycetidae sp. FL2044]|nr:hypothetical protein F4778DRAFT_783117 [Xylariomycetidae sp. FL2044]
MDWLSRANRFLQADDPFFTCDLDSEDGSHCIALGIFPEDAPDHLVEIELSSQEKWNEWFDKLNLTSEGDEPGSGLPRDSIHILFIPKAKDIVLQDGSLLKVSLKDLPITQENWEATLNAFQILPNHLNMSIARGETFASSDWARYNEEALSVMDDAVLSPHLLLGTTAELHLKRLEELVRQQENQCGNVTLSLETLLDSTAQRQSSDQGITSDLIAEIKTSRAESKKVEEEIKATKRQLEKVLPPAWSCSTGSKAPSERTPTDSYAAELVDYRYQQRFADIFAQLEGLMARCRISIEELSFNTDIIRSELARQETKHSGQEAKISTVIAFVAMLYLPMTTTIFAMPIFQWSNDWRDWRFNSVNKGNSSSSDDGNGGTDGLPVFSGYFWIYLGISLGFTWMTIEGWWRFTSREVERRKGHYWLRYLLRKLLSGHSSLSLKANFLAVRELVWSRLRLLTELIPKMQRHNSPSQPQAPRSTSPAHQGSADSPRSRRSLFKSALLLDHFHAMTRGTNGLGGHHRHEEDTEKEGNATAGSAPAQQIPPGSPRPPGAGNDAQMFGGQMQGRRDPGSMV